MVMMSRMAHGVRCQGYSMKTGWGVPLGTAIYRFAGASLTSKQYELLRGITGLVIRDGFPFACAFSNTQMAYSLSSPSYSKMQKPYPEPSFLYFEKGVPSLLCLRSQDVR